MVIGNGMIAKRFTGYTLNDKFAVFASGVSNSANTDMAEFEREKQLLQKSLAEHTNRLFVYISTCSIYDPSLQQSAYVLHKLAMEQLIIRSGIQYTIFRVSNPVGRSANKHTFLNYFTDHIVQQKPFSLWKYASRNLIDLDDMYTLADYLLKQNNIQNAIVNIANPINYSVLDIAKAIEQHYHIAGNYTIIEKGNSPFIDTSVIQPFFSMLSIDFGTGYLHHLLAKYYPLA